jgi:mono/diheme cytochrome c family protein
MKTLKFLALIGLLGILGGIGAATFFFGGFYSVAGTQEEPAFVKWAMIQVRQASIARHAATVEAPPATFVDAATVQVGARAYSERGCVNCHGGPGIEWAKFSEGLHPDPPDLKEIVNDRSPRELFWVIKNGINMTGMPAFGGEVGVPDAELWTIVAFLKKLPGVSDADFKTWSAPADAPPKP